VTRIVITGSEGLDQVDSVPVAEAKQRMVAAFFGDVAAAAQAWESAALTVTEGRVDAAELDTAIDYAGFGPASAQP
jgi:hypothetical protein